MWFEFDLYSDESDKHAEYLNYIYILSVERRQTSAGKSGRREINQYGLRFCSSFCQSVLYVEQ